MLSNSVTLSVKILKTEVSLRATEGSVAISYEKNIDFLFKRLLRR